MEVSFLTVVSTEDEGPFTGGETIDLESTPAVGVVDGVVVFLLSRMTTPVFPPETGVALASFEEVAARGD